VQIYYEISVYVKQIGHIHIGINKHLDKYGLALSYATKQQIRF